MKLKRKTNVGELAVRERSHEVESFTASQLEVVLLLSLRLIKDLNNVSEDTRPLT